MTTAFGSELDGQVAIVTGASSGIGEATATALASRGASVVLAARREDALEEVAARIEDEDGEALVVPTDITADDDIDELVETTTDEFGRIDILVNNAGYMPLAHIADADRETLTTTIDVNLDGLLTLTHAVVPTMLEQERGHVVNLSSVAGRFAMENSSHYMAAKAAWPASAGRFDATSPRRGSAFRPSNRGSQYGTHRGHPRRRGQVVRRGLQPIDATARAR